MKFYNFEDYYEYLPEKWQPSFLEARNIISNSHPQLVEAIRFNSPFYLYKGLLFYLSMYKKRDFILGFCNGAHLSDEAGVLRADAKQKHIRHWVFNSNQKIDSHLLLNYIHEAIIVRDMETITKTKNNLPKPIQPLGQIKKT